MLRLSLELRQVSRQVRDPYFSSRPLVRGLALLLAGDLAAASRELRGADPAPGRQARRGNRSPNVLPPGSST